MGKKSKRRGVGGGGKRNAGVLNTRSHTGDDQQAGSGGTLARVDTDTFSAEEAAALLRVPTPGSFQGIISTNREPDKCVFCLSDLYRCTSLFVECCGKALCQDCGNSPDRPVQVLDLSGMHRCVFCNALTSKKEAILKQEAHLGKAWAQYMYGLSKRSSLVATEESLHWYRKAASAGNPHAFIELADVLLRGNGINRDLQLSKSFAEKARSLLPNMGLRCNRRLLNIVYAYIKSGKKNEAQEILLSITREADESALDAKLCTGVAARISNDQISAEMYARAFYLGQVESAISASDMFYCIGKYPLSKLWLDVACKSKSLFKSVRKVSTGESLTWSDYHLPRDIIRSKLREMRNSCCGCGSTLEGGTRKYCRCCRTYCYCNENCQKKHWDNGHRKECKEVEEHMRNILRAIRLGRFDSLCES